MQWHLKHIKEEDEELKKLPDDAVREAMWLFSHLLRNRINVGETLPSDYAGAALEAFRFAAPARTLHETGATLMAKKETAITDTMSMKGTRVLRRVLNRSARASRVRMYSR